MRNITNRYQLIEAIEQTPGMPEGERSLSLFHDVPILRGRRKCDGASG